MDPMRAVRRGVATVEYLGIEAVVFDRVLLSLSFVGNRVVVDRVLLSISFVGSHRRRRRRHSLSEAWQTI